MVHFFERGFSMLELLIAIVVLSLGLLALASFQLKLFAYLSANQQYFQASLLAQSVAEEIQANRFAAADYNGLDTRDLDDNCAASDTSTVAANLSHWCQQLKQQGFFDSHIQITVQGNTKVGIAVYWQTTKRIYHGATDEFFTMEVHL